ncbi:type IX secretion system membrane protein, PorP/SprF family [Parafilimonas terrae]|uniref:Type IX secretion system membrane protein, PorP/SprF family n=2 Tax=Parafilimonas terrae TaxID=1465490 RepID=A0A1I5YHL5_9BACT|nr:type IX secretion system membrane protein, PorP/SprF family [Parafilimonas terrae]
MMLMCFGSHAQDIGFSQFYDQPLLRNPALAGIFNGDIRFTASYRNQWQSVTIPYRTFGISSEIKFPMQIMDYDVTGTFGLEIFRDVAGTSEFSTTQILPAWNISVRTGENSFLSGGFMAGLMQQKFDPSKLILNDQFVGNSDGSFSVLPYTSQVFNKTSVNYLDLSLGVTYKSSLNENVDFYVGAGLFHLTNPSVGFFDGSKIMLNKKLALNAGLSNAIGDANELILYADYFDQYTSNFKRVGINTAQFGIMYNHAFFESDGSASITGGLLYRWNDAIIPVVQLELAKFTIGASYDANVSKLVVASQARGGFELTLSFKSFLNSRNPDLMSARCPGFGKRKTNPYY